MIKALEPVFIIKTSSGAGLFRGYVFDRLFGRANDQKMIRDMKKRKAAGITKRSESILSRMPPCPGMMFPLSLMWRFRLIMDSNRSPKVAAIVTRIPRRIHSVSDRS